MAGQPTKYSEEMQKEADAYIDDCIRSGEIPYIEELALRLGVDDTTLINWMNRKDDKEELVNPIFFATYKRIKTLQKLRLMKGSVTNKLNPVSSIFQLKVNHGMIETEKKILLGDKENPLTVVFDESLKQDE